ncbi:MAG: hypothetical protein HQL27_02675 [Candidatus Omnitrophica bacterium]|nr:hypothetical protein [Candidatus Omnitrophota bacterium]
MARKEGIVTILEGYRYENGIIKGPKFDPKLREEPIVVFKGVYDEKFLNELRKTVVSFKYNYSDYTKGEDGLTFNYRREDKLHDRKRRARFNIGYHFYFWNKETPQMVKDVYYAMVRFGNMVSGREENDRLKLVDEKIGTMSYYYYPAGGFLSNHHFSDDIGGYDEIFDEIVIQFSKYGRDFKEGGVYVAKRHKLSDEYSPNDHSDLQFIEPLLDPGDVFATTIKDCYHRVTPIDPKKDYFNPLFGRFIASMYYVPTVDLKKLSKSAY